MSDEEKQLQIQTAEEYREYVDIMKQLRQLYNRSRPVVKQILAARAPMDAQEMTRGL